MIHEDVKLWGMTGAKDIRHFYTEGPFTVIPIKALGIWANMGLNIQQLSLSMMKSMMKMKRQFAMMEEKVNDLTMFAHFLLPLTSAVSTLLAICVAVNLHLTASFLDMLVYKKYLDDQSRDARYPNEASSLFSSMHVRGYEATEMLRRKRMGDARKEQDNDKCQIWVER
ncbi:hypothetical protein ACJX0J_037492 [Zea mays]